MVEHLDSALKKMPCYEGDLTRSLYFGNKQLAEEYIRNLKVGEVIISEGFMSTTCGNELYNPDGEIQIYIKNSKKGRDVSPFNSSEQEVLYERGFKFRVQYIVERDGKYSIGMEEL